MKLTKLQQLLKKYHEGTATDAERYVVDRWYASFGEAPEGTPGLGDDAERKAIRARIWQGLHQRGRRIPWYRHGAFRVAASITLVAAVAVGLYIANNPVGQSAKAPIESTQFSHVITTGSRQLKQVQLPDSTQVWLNANARLEVLPDYGKVGRSIRLTGEAFFEVQRDTTLPFEVVANGIVVKVLGTSFNIRSYESPQDISVVVSTGRVLVTDAASQHLAELTVGQELTYHIADGSYRLGEVVAANSHAWRNGKVVLDRAGFGQLAQSFYNLYGMELKTDDKEVASYRYNLTLQSTMRLEDAMELICRMVNKNYRKEDNGTVRIY